jgi:ABC-type phosphate/phosphonate transport system permease subunit
MLLFLVGAGIGVIAGFILCSIFTSGKLADGYDQQAYNADANSALRYLREGNNARVKSMLDRIIRRTGMGRRN